MSKFSKISISLFIFTLLLFFISKNREIATLLNNTVCLFTRKLLGSISGVVRFSVFEFFCILTPFLCFLSFFYIRKPRRIQNIISVFLLMASFYILNLGIAYNAKTDLSYEVSVKEEEILESARSLLENINSYSYPGDIADIADCFPKEVKKIASSPLLTRLGVLGFYSFATSEANINTLLPEYMYAFTVFHEMAHVNGYAREGEANLYAYIKLKETENELFGYYADLYAIEHILNDVYKISKEEYRNISSALPDFARSDMKKYRELLEKHPEIKISKKINDSYHSAFDKASYSDFSRLITLYLARS